MVKAIDIGPLVGAGKFFSCVSSRMAYALPIGHQSGLRSDSHSASTRAGSFNVFFADFLAKERATGFLGYDAQMGNKQLVVAGDRVLLGVLPTCALLFDGIVCRSVGGEELFYKDASTGMDAEFTSYAALKAAACSLGQAAFMKTVAEPADDVIAATKLPINACVGGDGFAEFPAFDLFASRIGNCRVGDDPNAYPTIKLASADGMTEATSQLGELDGFMMPEVPSCEDWLVWMQPVADVPETAFMRLKMDVLVANK